MQDLHKDEKWYRRLTKKDKAVVADLKAAQSAQGNDEALKPGYFNSQLSVALIDLEEHNLECDLCPTLGQHLVAQAYRVEANITNRHVNRSGAAHKLRGLDMILMAMELIITDRPIGVQEVMQQAGSSVVLGDETVIAGTTWKMLKGQAMQADYSTQPWFVSCHSSSMYLML